MAPNFPYRFVSPPKGISHKDWERTAREIWRDFQALASQIGGGSASGFDAIVAFGATDDDDARIYGTPYAAITALARDGYQQMRIGVTHDQSSTTSTVYTETTTLAPTTWPQSIVLVGLGVSEGNALRGRVDVVDPEIVWDVANTTWSAGSAVTLLQIEGLNVSMTGRTTGIQVFGSSITEMPTLYLRGVFFNGPDLSSVAHFSINLAAAFESSFENVFQSPLLSPGRIVVSHCTIFMRRTTNTQTTFQFGPTSTSTYWHLQDVQFGADNGEHIFDFECGQASVFDGIANYDNTTAGGDEVVTLRITSGGTVQTQTDGLYLRGTYLGSAGAGSPGPHLDVVASALRSIRVEGAWRDITSTGGSDAEWVVDVLCRAFDIRGANSVTGFVVARDLAPNVAGRSVRLDDTSVNLVLSCVEPDPAAGTLVDLNNVDTGYVRLIISQKGGGSGSASHIPYDIDAASSNGVLFYEALYTAAAVGTPVNSSATWLVWDHNGPTSSALTAHINDAVDAHDASAISIADAGGFFTGTEVEASLQELGSSVGSLTSASYDDIITQVFLGMGS